MRQLRRVRPSDQRTATRSLRSALGVAVARSTAAVAAIAATYATGNLLADLSRPVPGPAVREADPAVAMMARYRCSTSGLPDGEVPASTLIRTPDGRVRHVSFDRGWRVHTGDGPGTLVAVCRDPLR